MKIKEPRAMKEIHDIRLKLYKERRHLTAEEEIKLINENAKKFLNDIKKTK